MNNYNQVQGILNPNTNPYYNPYMPQLFSDAYQNGMYNQGDVMMPMSLPNPGFQEHNQPVAQNQAVEEPIAPQVVIPAEPEPVKPKNKRRSKNEKNGRTYICECGKDYLSYPALYTHIKTKHGGKNPNGTNQPSSSRARGRPKKVLFLNYQVNPLPIDKPEDIPDKPEPKIPISLPIYVRKYGILEESKQAS